MKGPRQLLEDAQDRLEPYLTARDRQLLSVAGFLLRFALLALPLYLLLWYGWDPVWLRQLNATAAAGVLDLVGVPAAATGTFLETAQLTVDVSTDSTGWKSLLALTALILATREPARKKLAGLVLAVPLVAAGNLLRLVSMVYAVEVLGISYELLHTLLWRWGLTLLILAAWLAWLRWETMTATDR